MQCSLKPCCHFLKEFFVLHVHLGHDLRPLLRLSREDSVYVLDAICTDFRTRNISMMSKCYLMPKPNASPWSTNEIGWSSLKKSSIPQLPIVLGLIIHPRRVLSNLDARPNRMTPPPPMIRKNFSLVPSKPISNLVGYQLSQAHHQPVDKWQYEVYSAASQETPRCRWFVEH